MFRQGPRRCLRCWARANATCKLNHCPGEWPRVGPPITVKCKTPSSASSHWPSRSQFVREVWPSYVMGVRRQTPSSSASPSVVASRIAVQGHPCSEARQQVAPVAGQSPCHEDWKSVRRNSNRGTMSGGVWEDVDASRSFVSGDQTT